MVDRLDKRMELLYEETRDLRGETNALRSEMHNGFAALQRQMQQQFVVLTGLLVTTLAAVVVAAALG